MKTETVTCDACKKDITYADRGSGYIYILGNQKRPSPPDVMTAIETYPPLDRAHHFCGRECLWTWVIAELLLRAKFDKKAAELIAQLKKS